jgi:hypothetical protein
MQPRIVQTTAGHLQDSHPIIHLCMPYFYGWTTWTASAYTQGRSPRRHGPVEFLVLSSERNANEIDARSLSSTHMTTSRSSASTRIMTMKSATGIWVAECFKREKEPHFVTFIHIHTVHRSLVGKPKGKRQLWRPRRRREERIKLMSEKWVGTWTGLIWLMIGISSVFVWTLSWPCGFRKLRGISWLTRRLSAS